MPNIAEKIDGKKFMWDKENYPAESEAMGKMTKYEKEGFETGSLKKKPNILCIQGGL